MLAVAVDLAYQALCRCLHRRLVILLCVPGTSIYTLVLRSILVCARLIRVYVDLPVFVDDFVASLRRVVAMGLSILSIYLPKGCQSWTENGPHDEAAGASAVLHLAPGV